MCLVILTACDEQVANKKSRLYDLPEEKEVQNTSILFLKELIKEDPESDEARYKLAVIYLKENSYQQAMEYITEALKIQEKPEYYLLKAKLHKYYNEVELGYKSVSKAISLGLKSVDTYHYKAYFLSKKGDYRESANYLIKVPGWDSFSQYVFALNKLAAKDTLEAINSLKKVSDLKETGYEPLSLLYSLLYEVGEYEEFNEFKQVVLSLLPQNSQVNYFTGLDFYRKNMIDTALYYFAEAKKGDLNSVKYAEAIAQIYSLKRKYQEVIVVLEPHSGKKISAKGRAQLAYAYLYTKDLQKSLENYKKVVEIAPNHKDAQNKARYLEYKLKHPTVGLIEND